jgi:hypothetical protein
MANPPRPPQPTDDQPDSIMLQKFVGLKNVVDAERLGPDELERAVNIDLDDVGQIHRRRGQTLKTSGNFGSLFTTEDGVVFATKDGSLGIILSNFSFNAIDSGYPTDPLAYVQVGPSLYFSSRTRAGVIDLKALTVSPWGSTPDIFFSPVVNPTATLPAIRGRLYGPPPLATILGYFNGRIYMGTGCTVWATELFLYNFVDKTKNFWNFEADVTMIGVVTDGIYVGTKEGVWFISGPFAEAKRVRVMDTPCIAGSMTYVPGELANPPQAGLDQDTKVQVSILFLTEEGYCGGMDSGIAYNYTENKFVFPNVASAVGAFRRQQGVNQYLVMANSGGTPAANARIGDYVDAELIRGGAWNTIRDCLKVSDAFVADFS